MNENNKTGMNEQDASRKEGQYGNTSASPNAEENVSMGISQMNEDNRSGNNKNEGRQGEQSQSSSNREQ